MKVEQSDSLVSFIQKQFATDPVLMSYYTYLYQNFNPNITGYILVFMIPPDLSGIQKGGGFIQSFAWQTRTSLLSRLNTSKIDLFARNYDPSGGRYLLNTSPLNLFSDEYDPETISFNQTSPLLTFAAAKHSPPQTQITSAQITPRSGGVPYATDVSSTENCSVTYIDNMDCTVYLYHLLWAEYIRAVANGAYFDGKEWVPLAPSSEYTTPGDPKFGTLDYAAAIYVVKYMPDMHSITYIGKSIGCIPTSLPSEELIGDKSNNELAMLNFGYTIGAYREFVSANETNSWLYTELNDLVLSSFGDQVFSTRNTFKPKRIGEEYITGGLPDTLKPLKWGLSK